MANENDRPLPHTIGPGWSDDPAERARQIADQERVVAVLARALEDFDYDNFDNGDF